MGARLILTSPGTVALLLALAAARCGACGEEVTPPPPPPPPDKPLMELMKVERVAEQRVEVTAALGGTVELGGARLEIPAGALAEDVAIRVLQYAIPTRTLDPADGAFGGQRLLSDSAFWFGGEREVALSAPVTIRLPVDLARLPGGQGRVRFSRVSGGLIIPQDLPATLDEATRTLVIELPFAKLPLPDAPTGRIVPQFAGVPFAYVLVLLAAVIANEVEAPLVASWDALDDLPEHLTDNFAIRYDPATAPIEEVKKVGGTLERAHSVFTRFGFSRPAITSYVFRHIVYLRPFDDFTFMGRNARGFDIPGSTLFNGASYVNTSPGLVDPNWESTAAHEYWHAVSYGPLSTLAPNFWLAGFTEMHWLMEGTATIMEGRVIAGDVPSRDLGLTDYLKQNRSLYSGKHEPDEVAQDLFFYLERSFGSAMYLPLFEGTTTPNPLAGVPPSVSSLDATLRALDPGGLGLADHWSGFIETLTITAPELFGGGPEPRERLGIPVGTGQVAAQGSLPPLSYEIVEITVPAWEKDKPITTQPGDVVLTLESTGAPLTFLVDAAKDGARMTFFPKRLPAGTERIPEVRSAKENKIRVVAVNPALPRSADAVGRVTARLAEPAPVEAHVVYSYLAAGNYGIRVLELPGGTTWDVPGTEPIGVSQQGALLHHDARSHKVMVTRDWGRGASLDLASATDCRPGSISADNVGIAGGGRVYFPGLLTWYDADLRPHDVAGMVSCLPDGTGPVPVRLDLNESGEIDSVDAYYPDFVRVAHAGRPLVFDAIRPGTGKRWLATVDTSGAGLRWLTPMFSEDLIVSGDGSVAAFQLDQEHGFRPGMIRTTGGTALDFSSGTSLDIDPEAMALNAEGTILAAQYTSVAAQDYGIALFSTSDGRLLRKLSTLSVAAPALSRMAFTRDGAFLIFAASALTPPQSPADIYLMPMEGTGLVNLTHTPDVSEEHVIVE